MAIAFSLGSVRSMRFAVDALSRRCSQSLLMQHIFVQCFRGIGMLYIPRR